MKVRVCEDVTVDTEVDVDLHDVITEYWLRIESADELPRGALSVVDGATRILAAVPDSIIARASPMAVTEAINRLTIELTRWQSAQEIAAAEMAQKRKA